MLCDLCGKEERISEHLCATCLDMIARLARVAPAVAQTPPSPPQSQRAGAAVNWYETYGGES